MKNKEAKLQYKIGDAVLSEEAAEKLVYWQENDNEPIEGIICSLLKVGRFIACKSSSNQFNDEEMAESMRHIITISELARDIEVFKK